MRYDVVIVGSGAGAGPLALRLSEAGLSVVVLEKGPRFSPEQYKHDAKVIADDMFTPKMQEDPHTIVTKQTTRSIPSQFGWTASCVGGGTEHMGAYLYRFHPSDFKMLSTYGADAYDGVTDWPYTYDDLEPYYSEAEQEVGVSGAAGANPFEGPRSRPYPMPPLDAHSLATNLESVCQARGLTAFPTPRAISSVPYGGRDACAYCETCAGYGCPIGARGSSLAALLPRAEATGNCEIISDAMVFKITMDKDGKATGCLYKDKSGNMVEVRANLVCVCCSAVESARLLLLSKNDQFPNGLANTNGLVGKNLQFHAVTMGQGIIPELDDVEQESVPFLGRSVMDYYFLPDGISTLNKGGILRFGFVPRLESTGREHIARQQGSGSSVNSQRTGRSVYFEVFHDFLSSKNCHVTLDPDYKDKWGLPCARISLDIHKHHKLVGKWLGAKGCEILQDLGAKDIFMTDVGGTSSYLVMGTCRAGHNPDSSTLNQYCQTHDISNLYVVDGSFIPTSAGGPPTLTILANSFRVADRLLKSYFNL